MKTKVFPGFRSGKLVMVRFTGNKKWGSPECECACDCGNTSFVRANLLSAPSNPVQSCGCSHTEHQIKINLARRLPDGEAACHAVYVMLRNTCARHRGLDWQITFEEWKILSKLPCHYCGLPPSNHIKGGYGRNGGYTYSGLDRVDNGVGYVSANVVPCCKLCNQAKSTLSIDDFKAWICRVYEHTIRKA